MPTPLWPEGLAKSRMREARSKENPVRSESLDETSVRFRSGGNGETYNSDDRLIHILALSEKSSEFFPRTEYQVKYPTKRNDKKIISGGQAGANRADPDFAIKLGRLWFPATDALLRTRKIHDEIKCFEVYR
jgi:hypothetical protein